MSDPPARSPSSLLIPYAAPYLLYVGLGALVDAHTHAEWLYAARFAVVGGALAWFWRDYLPLRGPRSAGVSLAIGALAGLACTGLWLALHAPFAPRDVPAWSDSAWLARALGSAVLPPFIEELLFRGWMLPALLLFERARTTGSSRLAAALDRSSLSDVEPGAWSALAVGVSSAVFAAGHAQGEWLAAFAYGVAMCALWIARGDLVSCISAHAVTNAALALFVRATGSWGSW